MPLLYPTVQWSPENPLGRVLILSMGSPSVYWFFGGVLRTHVRLPRSSKCLPKGVAAIVLVPGLLFHLENKADLISWASPLILQVPNCMLWKYSWLV